MKYKPTTPKAQQVKDKYNDSKIFYHYTINTNFDISEQTRQKIERMDGVRNLFNNDRYCLSLYIGVLFNDRVIVRRVVHALEKSVKQS